MTEQLSLGLPFPAPSESPPRGHDRASAEPPSSSSSASSAPRASASSAPASSSSPPGTPASGSGEESRVRYGGVDLARALGRPDPTPEQLTVIEAGIDPLLVVAGAGSGKTETMAARVVWLVANGFVAPEDVLGLTFTRKAAAELADRVRARLRALHRRGLLEEDPRPVPVSTYHAYAAGVLADHGLRIGVEPGSRLLGEAGAWQVASDVVARWDGDMSGVDSAPSTVTEAVLGLAGECAEHLVEPAAIERIVEDLLDRVARLPDEPGGRAPGRPRSKVRDLLGKLDNRRRFVPLVEAYVRRKRRDEVLDFGDQLALAARIARDVPEVGAGERARYRVVLLDEYQDTSHAQLVLLRSLFGGGHPVVAVGDPHQSIYGWRGASAGNLRRFPADFPRAAGSGEVRPAATCYLSTSWRNDRAILDVANRVSVDLRVPAPWTTGENVAVPPLRARADAGPGRVSAAWVATVQEEADLVADRVAEQWRATASPPTAAVLCRARAQFPMIGAALRARGLPVEIVGLGGLLAEPEVADLRAALEVLHDPTRGDSLMRLLTGPTLRIGPRDLQALDAWARARASRRSAAVQVDAVDERSIVDALDRLPPPGAPGLVGRQLSPTARSRLDRFGATLRDLRGRTGLSLVDLVFDVERALLLDIDVAARPGVRPAAARVHLDAFAEVAAGFAAGFVATGDRPGLGAFLAWLTAADARERGLEAPIAQVRRDAVQVLTVHAAKGLEWDVVAVTGLAEGTFPSGRTGRVPSASNGWLGESGALPYPLRGDAAGLPRWQVESAATQRELEAELETFRTHCALHAVAEERRLAYVAITRARRSLLLTGAVWGDGSTPRDPSRFLQEAAAADGVERISWQDPPAPGALNPGSASPHTEVWPRDVLGVRRPAVEAGAALVRAALLDRRPADERRTDESPANRDPVDEGDPEDPWGREVDLLLAERDARARHEVVVRLPAHLSASRVVALARDREDLALRLRRPMPEPPDPHARRGSAFHAWLERRFGAGALMDLDEVPGAADDAAGDEELGALQETFLAGEWADRTPEAVEVSVETPIGGLVVRGRIDAVFALPGGAWEVVDWKTGRPPRDRVDGAAAAVQLAVYRLAWSRLAGVRPEQVRAAFFYVSTGMTWRPVDLLDEAGLEELIERALAAPPNAPSSAGTDPLVGQAPSASEISGERVAR